LVCLLLMASPLPMLASWLRNVQEKPVKPSPHL